MCYTRKIALTDSGIFNGTFLSSFLQKKFEVKDYMKSQPDLTTSMRAILVDWLVEVQENFELNHETLYLAVKMVDIYLGLKTVSREKLQLIGATALFIASKFDVSVTYASERIFRN